MKVDPDELRNFHPNAHEFRAAHPYTWSSLTHHDAGQWADELLDATVAGKKNLIFDTTLSNGQWASELIKDLQAKGYEVEVRAIASPKLESELGVDDRFTRDIDKKGTGRYVPEGARDAIYDKLPASLDTVHAQTDVPIRLFNREGVELYDSRTDARLPGVALEDAREARLKNPGITRNLRDGWKEQQAWHRDLPETLPNNPKVDPATRANLLAERSANHVSENVERAAREAIEIDHVTRVRPTRIRAGAALGIAGLALDAYDAADSVRTANRLIGEGNATAAGSELIHFGSRTVGGLAGAGLGATAGAAAGVETGPGLLVTGAIGGVAGVFAGNKIAEWTDNRRIYNQEDRRGNTWTHDPENPALGWQRKAPIDASNDDINNPMRGTLRASPALANELNYKSTSISVELVLGGPPAQRDPFVQPANATDSRSVSSANWTRNTDSGEWRREVVLAFAERGLSPKRIEVADSERATELDHAAAQAVLQNAANSPAAIAARYEDAYIRNGWAAHGEMPKAVRNARTDVDTLIASDENRYQRRADGEWVSTGLLYNSTATGNLREELDATREVLQAKLPPPQAVRAPAPMTEDARLRDTVAGAYANAGVTPSAERIEASATAVRATWTANGFDPNTTALQLQPGTDGRYGPDSPIASMRLESDGRTYRIAAVTTIEDIQHTQGALQTAPHAIDAPSAQARDVRTQALQEANRLGLSREDAQQVARQETVRLPATFAPAQGFAKDLRDEAHPGHAAYRKSLDDVRRMEARNNIPQGDHSERLAAAVAVTVERDHLHVQRLDLGKEGQVIAVERGLYPNFEERRVPIDTRQALAQSFEKTSMQWLEARSPHYAYGTPAKARTEEQALSITQLSTTDQAMFAKIRQGAPANVSDDLVAHAMLLAKKDGMADASKIGQTAFVGDKLWIVGTTPGFRVAAEVSSPTPPLQDTLQQAQSFNQQRELQVAQEAMQRGQSEPVQGPRLG